MLFGKFKGPDSNGDARICKFRLDLFLDFFFKNVGIFKKYSRAIIMSYSDFPYICSTFFLIQVRHSTCL